MTTSESLTCSICTCIHRRHHHHLLDFVSSYLMSRLLFPHAAQARVPEVPPTTTSASNNLDPIPSLMTLM